MHKVKKQWVPSQLQGCRSVQSQRFL
ncbi:MAG: hypothetical protein ACLS6Y_06475 [Streptococcus salivarius]